MGALEERIDDNLLGLEIVQVHDCYAWIGLVVDEQVAAVVIAVGLGNRGMVGITVDDVLAVDAPLGQHGLGFIIEAVALPWLRCEHRDVFENTHGRNAVDDNLTALTARAEDHVFITPAGWCIGFRCRQHVLFGQAACLHHVFQCILRPGAGCTRKRQPGTGQNRQRLL